jgi:predicted dienelactone hydrolase
MDGVAGTRAPPPSAGIQPRSTLDASMHEPDRTASDGGPVAAPTPIPHALPANDDDSGMLQGVQQDAGRQPANDYAVGTIRIEIAAHDGRSLPAQLWYPAVEAAREEARAGHLTAEFEPQGQRRTRLTNLIDAAPKECTNRTMHAALGVQPNALAAKYPLLVFSHHHSGVRFSTFTMSEGLASLGFVVAAVDHEGDTVYDNPDDPAQQLGTLSADFLQTRAADIGSLLDVLLDPTSTVVPDRLRGQIDPTRVGAFGHSMGSFTAAVVAVSDPRIKAASFIAMASSLDLLGSPSPASFRVPALYVRAEEDAVEGQFSALYGTDLIRKDFAEQPPPAWLIDVRDTAHWSFADDCALTSGFADGCGQGIRQTDGSSYTNLENAKARAIASRYVAAFFANQFLGRPADALNQADPPDLVRVTHHDQQPASAAGQSRQN